MVAGAEQAMFDVWMAHVMPHAVMRDFDWHLVCGASPPGLSPDEAARCGIPHTVLPLLR